MTGKKVIAIIPARGGSKGIPKKNLYPILGKPLITYSINTALSTQLIDHVIVTTDDNEIAKIARDSHAKVIIRPAKLSDDNASSESALIHSISELKKANLEPDIIVFIQCTSPLTKPWDIDNAIEKFLEKKADSLLSVTRSHIFLWREDENGLMTGINHDKNVRLRRQDFDMQYQENGAFYIFDTKGFLKAGHRFFGKITHFIMPQDRSIEIDSLIDVKIVEAIMKEEESQLSEDIY